MRRRLFIVRNRFAGVPRQRFFDAVVDRLRSAGAEVHLAQQDDPDAAIEGVRAAIATSDAIVAAGGDGTVRLVAGAVGRAPVPVGLIPLGTGNVLAREIGLARTPDAVARTLLEGRVEIVHGGTANGAPFYLMAGAGFDGRTVSHLDYRLKRVLGRAAYADAVIRAWKAPVDVLDVEVDGQPYRANWVIVTNARHYGGSFVLSPRRSIFAPGLEAILIRAPGRLKLASQMLRLAHGSIATSGNASVTAVPATRVTVRSHVPVPTQLDGDGFGTTPLAIDADGPQLRLIVPG